MKINTITCHDVYNHGASLQAFALQNYLQSRGHDVEIIDYKPWYLSGHHKLCTISNPRWDVNFLTRLVYLMLKLPNRLIALQRKKAFDDFRKQFLQLTDQRYTCNEDLKRDVPQAEVYIAGSDQIWNTLFLNGRDAAFYLDFAPARSRKVAYAASFATDSIVPESVEFVRQQLKNFDRIAVRESGALSLLCSLGIENATWVCDPVFLIEKEHWNVIATKVYSEKYILIYDFEQNDVIQEIATQVAIEQGLKIYSVNVSLRYVDRSYPYVGPAEFVSLIRNAEYVLSNSFHGTAFALIYNKEFIVVPRKEGINTRMQSLLSYLDLSDRYAPMAETAWNLPKIDYVRVNQKIKNHVEVSVDFLRNALK